MRERWEEGRGGREGEEGGRERREGGRGGREEGRKEGEGGREGAEAEIVFYDHDFKNTLYRVMTQISHVLYL